MVKHVNTLDITRRYIYTLRHKLILTETKALGKLLESKLEDITASLNALLNEENPVFNGVQIIEGTKANQLLQLVILESMLRLPLGLEKKDIYLEAIHYLAAAEDFIKRLKEAGSDKRISTQEVVQALRILEIRGIKLGILSGDRNLVICLPTFKDSSYFAHYFFHSNVICCLSGTDKPEFLLHELGHLINYRLTNNSKIPPNGYREALVQCAGQSGVRLPAQWHPKWYAKLTTRYRGSLTEAFADDFATYFLNEKAIAVVMQDYFADLCQSLQ